LDVRSFTLDANQIGVNRSVAVSPNRRAQKFVNRDGSQISVLIIKSSGASGIRAHFRDFALADGEEVYVYGTAPDSIVFGPYTNKGPWDSREFWSGTVDGDTVLIELHKRTDENAKGFEIFELSHIFTELDWRLRSNEPDVLNCEVDASCYGDIQKNAVARIVYNNNGDHVCTGTLLDDVAHDHCPYFLTANHCVPTQAVAQTVQLYWFYQTTSCNSHMLRSRVLQTGADLLETKRSNDFSLLHLSHDAPAGAIFAEWTPAAQPSLTAVFGLHHPDGYVPPDIPSYLRRSTGVIIGTNEDCQKTGLAHGYEADWTPNTGGGVEGGSSGSGLFTSNGHKLVGVLSCQPNPAACTFGLYSKFANFYSQIQPYIGSRATPARPVANPGTLVTTNSFTAHWRKASGATGYRLDVSRSSSFNTYVAGYHNLDVRNATSRSVTGLNPSTTYYYRVRAYNCHGASGNSNVVHLTTLTAVSYDGDYVGAFEGDIVCRSPGQGGHITGAADFEVANGVVRLCDGTVAGSVDSSGHINFFEAGNVYHFTGTITQDGHASGLFTYADNSNGCTGGGTWCANRTYGLPCQEGVACQQ
jgi:hypothetical protein